VSVVLIANAPPATAMVTPLLKPRLKSAADVTAILATVALTANVVSERRSVFLTVVFVELLALVLTVTVKASSNL